MGFCPDPADRGDGRRAVGVGGRFSRFIILQDSLSGFIGLWRVIGTAPILECLWHVHGVLRGAELKRNLQPNMIIKSKHLAVIALAGFLAQASLAQPTGQTNYQWSAAGDKTTWSQGANWTQGIAPLSDGTTYQIDLSVNAGTNRTPINLASTDMVAINDSVFGPLGGEILNINGTMTLGFGIFIWSDNTQPTAVVNINSGGSLYVRDTVALGTAWWFSPGANTTINVRTNGFLGVTWFQDGGRINVFNGGTVSVTNGWNTGGASTPVFSGGQDTDATRSINIEKGATLILPAGNTSVVNDWITRGILQVYGAPAAAQDIVIDEANATWPSRTVVTTTASAPSVMTAVHLQVVRTNLYVGGLEQAQVFADFNTSSNVNVTTTATNLVYNSSNTNIATISVAGAVRATGAGTVTLTATIGTFSNSVLVTVSNYTTHATLIHRYSFSDTVGSGTVMDSIPGNSPTWDGSLIGGTTLTGSQVTLDGASGFVQLPPGIITPDMDAVTIEAWVTLSSPIANWGVLYTFGDSDFNTGYGRNYISCQPHTGFTTFQIGISDANPGFSHEQDGWTGGVLDGYSNLHFVGVYHPEAGYMAIYTNGVLAAINTSVSITLAGALATGDPDNYIGRSLYNTDPYFSCSIDEFRIYSGPMTAGAIQADAVLGPDQLIGTSTNVSLSATKSGGNIMLSWPTTSALVNVLASPKLGPGATWAPVTGTMSVVGGNYHMVVPATGAAQYFRLQQ